MVTASAVGAGSPRQRRQVRHLVVAGLSVSLMLIGCAAGVASPPASAQRAQRPLPAGRTPSGISKMVCAREAQREIAQTLGVRASVSRPTWVDHIYSCRYRYPDGGFVLTIKELSSWSQTLAYYSGIGRNQGRTATVPNLGQGAFQTDNGSAVVRKDWKVLTVDISGLPPQFGRPPTSRGDVAVTVADVILACWAGD